ncbi:MAG TPA: Crp/Fnr family transcriptional regulator [Xanthobacteraceae bacterium]|nr:Crp/Fnr family transcriptional regulator [Xanthobacteraceae bacterium]
MRNDITRNRLLQNLDPAELALIEKNLKSVEMHTGDVLHSQRSRIEKVYFPLSGMVSSLMMTDEGDAIETAAIGREGVVGGSAAVITDTAITQTVVQLDGRALAVPSSILVEACSKSMNFHDAMRRYEAVLTMQANQSSACHALHSVAARLCRWLLHFHDFAETDEFSLTQETISHMLGVRRSSVSVAAHELQHAGLITYSRGRIQILDREGMEECACECYGAVRKFMEETLPRHH